MTRQQELREGIAEKIFEWCKRNGYIVASFEWKELQGAARGMILAITDIVLEYEDSQGVVIKVDDGEIELEDEGLMARVLPDIFDGSLSISQYDEEREKYLTIARPIEEELKDTGYVAVEPLRELV